MTHPPVHGEGEGQRLLFLDFDGVLHPNHCPPTEWFRRAGLLAEALIDVPYRPEIVISSSWRFHHEYLALLEFLPTSLGALVSGVTGSAEVRRYARYQEITSYLRGWYDQAEWVALDDCAWEFPPECPNLILCNGNTGVAKAEIDQLVRWCGN